MARKLWKDIWTALNTEIEFSWAETATSGIETGKAVLELAKALDENKTVKELAPLVGRISSLLDVLNNPLVQVAGSGLPFVSIAVGMLKFYVDQTRKEPTLEICVALVSQAAYLESLRAFLNSSNNKAIRNQLLEQPASEVVTKRIRAIGERLEIEGKELELNDWESEEALICFHESKLAQVFNTVLKARLSDAGLEDRQAEIVTERVSRSTHRYMKRAFAEARESVKRLAAVYGDGWQKEIEVYRSVDDYLEDVIAQKPKEKVFAEAFGFEDVYVPLQVKPIDKNGQVEDKADSQNIHTWTTTLLEDPKKQGQVLFIQGGPGRGKSVFCRMFADEMRREWHPIWTPILIRLRDIRNFEQDFDKTLEDAVGTRFASEDDWLTDPNTRFLFLLDGFDELLLERGANNELRQFLDQVGLFQSRCAKLSERRHRVLITGRPLALYGIERLMPSNLERVEIIPMEQDIQKQWFAKWGYLSGTETTLRFQEFLQNQGCPQQIRNLAQEPLLLYLLAAMHRDGRLQTEMFEQASPVRVKIQIYEEALEWVLTKQRSDEIGRDLNPLITGLEPEDLRSILAEAGLCVVQSGGECASIAMIEERLKLKEDEGAKALIQAARKQSEKYPLKNALATFYMKSAAGTESNDPKVEFFHKSFGEFLCAERLLESLEAWTQKTGSRRKTYTIATQTVGWEIYDLLGFGRLTPEIVEYLMALLENRQIDLVALFERLEEFYLRWSKGEFIETVDDIQAHPRNKARQLQKQGINLGQRQVDIYAGLNVLILLLELNRYAQLQDDLKNEINFHPCSWLGSDEFDGSRLLRIISYSNCFRTFTSHLILGPFLSSTNLSEANLSGVDLSGANLVNTNLSGSDLSGACLKETDFTYANLSEAELGDANLSEAFLSHADLRGAELNGVTLRSADLSSANLSGSSLGEANLAGADLTGADLRYTYLCDSNLSGTDLRGANLSEADLRYTDLSNIQWDIRTRWDNAKGLHLANVSLELSQDPNFTASALLSEGLDLAECGKIKEALTAYEQAQKLNITLEVAASSWNALCWFGTIHGFASDVLYACEKAVTLEPDIFGYRDSRGLARALTNDRNGALEDFQAVVDGEIFYWSEGKKQQRQRWLVALQSGENPFSSEELKNLQQE